MCSLVALGSVWLDEIRKEGEPPILDVPGGSVTFATLGARLFANQNPKLIAMVFNAGVDFPTTTTDIFRSWGIDLHEQKRSEPAARGIVFYGREDGNRKGFQRLTEPLPVALQDLTDQQRAETRGFHIFGTAEDVELQFCDFESQNRSQKGDRDDRKLVVWEPHAKSCLPDKLMEHQKAARLVHVFSPNHEELASFFEGSGRVDFNFQEVERQARKFYAAMSGDGKNVCVVVRAAGHGCLVMFGESGRAVWLPSFYPSDSQQVVDPTGAGNAFLGGFVVGWQESGSYIEAAKYGMVAASFVIEQVGLPEVIGSGIDEQWNAGRVRDRLDTYRQRLAN